MKEKDEKITQCAECAWSVRKRGSWVWSKDKILCGFTGKEMQSTYENLKCKCSMFEPRKGCVECKNRLDEPVILADGSMYVTCTKLGCTKLVDKCEDYIPREK